jgi:murein DD-endopeptidase MepM/ murein hydrolase activator NlpD
LARQEAARDAGASVTTVAPTTTAPPVTTDDPGPTTTTSTTAPEPVPDTPDEPIVEPPPSGGMICPVPGSAFVDSWGAPRPQGWAHQGVDMMAPSGTPIVAPVSGNVVHRGNSVGGLAFHLTGDDGRYYYGAHLSAYGQAGNVAAGTVIGYVGNTGDAQYTAPHLHLEIHIGGSAVNPYPYVAAVC